MKFVKNEGFDVYGIDFSKNAIDSLKPEFGDNVIVVDIVNMPYENEFFDFCFDKSAIQHNPKDDIFKIHKEVYRMLKKNEKFFSIMLKEGDNGFLTGYLSEDELRKSLNDFEDLRIDYEIRTEDNGRKRFTAYIIEATK